MKYALSLLLIAVAGCFDPCENIPLGYSWSRENDSTIIQSYNDGHGRCGCDTSSGPLVAAELRSMVKTQWVRRDLWFSQGDDSVYKGRRSYSTPCCTVYVARTDTVWASEAVRHAVRTGFDVGLCYGRFGTGPIMFERPRIRLGDSTVYVKGTMLDSLGEDFR